MPTLRVAGSGFVLVLIGLLLTACAGSSEPANEVESGGLDIEGIDLDRYSTVTAKLDFEAGTAILPVNSISRRGPEIEALRVQAKQILTDACLRESGLPGMDWPPQNSPEEDRLFGAWSVSIAARYGFEVPDTAGSSEAEYSSEELRCLSSVKSEMQKLSQGTDTLALDTQVYSSSYDAVLASSEGKAALTAAQTCMKEKGLTIKPESGFPQYDGSSAGDSETNVRIAVTQATCNVETGAIQTLFDLTAKYQAALIDRNEAAAVALAEDRAQLVAGYRAIIDAAQ